MIKAMRPSRQQSFGSALMVGLLTISACATGSQRTTEFADPALDDLTAFVTNLGFDPTVSPLSEILADNKLELVEYESVANDVVDCLAARGIPAQPYYTESPGTYGYGFRVDQPDGMAESVVDAAFEGCETTTQFTPVAWIWASMVGPTEDENEKIIGLIDKCLENAGFAGGREASFENPDLTDLRLVCADEATTEVLSRR